MKKLPFIHDYYFRRLFQLRELALEHVEDYVPLKINQLLDLSTFALDNTNYIAKEMKESRSDLLYKCQFNNGLPFRLALLHEHKSKKPARDVRLQILQYILAIWALNDQQEQDLDFVLPSVIYNGRRKWEKGKLSDSFPGLMDFLLPYLPEYDYLLLDLPGTTDKEIIRRSEGKILSSGLLAMKHYWEPEYFKKNFEKVLNFDWRRYTALTWQSFLADTLSYISNATGFTYNDFRKLAKPLPTELNHFTMLTMESILEEGKKEGKKEGKIEGIKIGMEKKAVQFAQFLLVNFPEKSDEEISLTTGLLRSVVAKLRKEMQTNPGTKPKNGQGNGSH